MKTNKKLTAPNKEMVNYNFRNENGKLSIINGMKGFKEYKIQSGKVKFDCDCSKLTMSIWCLLLEEAAIVKRVKGYNGRKIYYTDIHGNEHVVETDTINSLERDLNNFIRGLIRRVFHCEWHELYSNGYGIKKGEKRENVVPLDKRAIKNSNQNEWIIKYHDELFMDDLLTIAEKEVLIELEKWPNSIHTLGNFMIGPVQFNVTKNTEHQDCLDLFYKISGGDPTYMEWEKQIYSLMNVNFLDDYFAGNEFTGWENTQLKNLRKNDDHEWMQEINHSIHLRGLTLSKKLTEMVDNL